MFTQNAVTLLDKLLGHNRRTQQTRKARAKKTLHLEQLERREVMSASPLEALTALAPLNVARTNEAVQAGAFNTLAAATRANLTPYKPAAWSASLVISDRTGTSTDGASATDENVYVDWAVANLGGTAASSKFLVTLYVDGLAKVNWQVNSLNTSTYVYVQDYSLGKLAAGQHTFQIKADTNNNIIETNEGDNTTSKASWVIDHPAAAVAYQPVSGALFNSGGPSYRDVHQGSVGDCWLMASLAEVAARKPAMIQSMFTYLGTTVEHGTTVGLYNVRFYNSAGAVKYVTVDTELPGGGNYYNRIMGGCLWVALAEKAYAQANGARFVTSGNMGSDSYAALNGGNPCWALQAITGKGSSAYSVNPTDIASAWNAGKFIVISSSSAPASQYIVGGSDGTHAYAVVNYTASNSSPYTVYNPWGTDSSGWALGNYNGHKVYGLFVCNGAFLSKNFAYEFFGVGSASSQSTLNPQRVDDLAARPSTVTAPAGQTATGSATAAQPASITAADHLLAQWGADPEWDFGADDAVRTLSLMSADAGLLG